MEDITVDFIFEEKENINVNFEVNVTPKKLSELENDTGFITKDDIKIPEIDLSNYATKSDLENKQNKLVAGKNITIVDNVISSTGDSGGSVDAYTKAETDAMLAQKQDVLGATDPISIGSTTMGGLVNVNIVDNKLSPLYTNLPNGNTTGSTTKIFLNDTISTPINDIETLFSGDCSYFDVPVNFEEHIASGQASEIKLELGGMDTIAKGYGMSFLLGEQTEKGFEPIIFGNTQYNSAVGTGIGQTWILDSIAQSTTNGRLTVNAPTNNTRPTTQSTDKYNGHRFSFTITGSGFKIHTGTGNNTTEYYTELYVSKTSEYSAKFSRINVIRCWWCPSNILSNYMPSVDNTILSYGGVDSGWRITDGAVTTYGVSLKYDDTLKVVDGKLALAVDINDIYNQLSDIQVRLRALEE